MKQLTPAQIAAVAGGYSVSPEGPDSFLLDEFMKYKMGQMSLFGVNPDTQMVPPPPIPG